MYFYLCIKIRRFSKHVHSFSDVPQLPNWRHRFHLVTCHWLSTAHVMHNLLICTTDLSIGAQHVSHAANMSCVAFLGKFLASRTVALSCAMPIASRRFANTLGKCVCTFAHKHKPGGFQWCPHRRKNNFLWSLLHRPVKFSVSHFLLTSFPLNQFANRCVMRAKRVIEQVEPTWQKVQRHKCVYFVCAEK